MSAPPACGLALTVVHRAFRGPPSAPLSCAALCVFHLHPSLLMSLSFSWGCTRGAQIRTFSRRRRTHVAPSWLLRPSMRGLTSDISPDYETPARTTARTTARLWARRGVRLWGPLEWVLVGGLLGRWRRHCQQKRRSRGMRGGRGLAEQASAGHGKRSTVEGFEDLPHHDVIHVEVDVTGRSSRRRGWRGSTLDAARAA